MVRLFIILRIRVRFEFENQFQLVESSFKLDASPVWYFHVTQTLSPSTLFSLCSASSSVEKYIFSIHFQLISFNSTPFSKPIASNFIILQRELEKPVDPLIWWNFER
jgi:hypothetical protein